MGQSTDAILAFGFNLTDEDEDPGALFGAPEDEESGDSFEFDDWIAERAGVVFPWVEGENIDQEKYKKYRSDYDAVLATCPVQLIRHCSHDYPMHFLALRGSSTKARRGYPEMVNPQQPTTEQIDKMKAFCEEHGLEWKTPSWHIFSYWS